MRLLPFLKPVIEKFVKAALWATSGVSKRRNSAKKFERSGKLDNKPD